MAYYLVPIMNLYINQVIQLGDVILFPMDKEVIKANKADEEISKEKLTDIANICKANEALFYNFSELISDERLKSSELTSPTYQMRKCFKLCVDGCPVNPPYIKSKVFIVMPFANDYLDSYNYGIVPALSALALKHFKADYEISNKDIMCKICQEIQSCSIATINISGLNPNIMLEQGLAYGLGKPVIIIKDTNTKAISDLGSIEYIEYSHAYDLQQKLLHALDK